VFIYDEIGGWGITALDFMAAVDAGVGAGVTTLNVRINSYGGEVFAALAMYNHLRRLSAGGVKIVVHVDGIAASAASVITMAGDIVRMPSNAFLMVHDPLIGIVGNARELRKIADTLDAIRDSLVGIYVNKSGKLTDEIVDLLANETWLSAAAAVEWGFADEIIDEVAIAANAALLAKHPKAAEFFAAVTVDEPAPELDEPSQDDEDYLAAIAAAQMAATLRAEWDAAVPEEDALVTAVVTTTGGDKTPAAVSKSGVSNLSWVYRGYGKGK
jgi:ATP-dependent protease ClpP protease subunit